MSEPLYHIAPRADWEAARAKGTYDFDALASEGFIHCSFASQVPGVAAAFFAGRTDLVVLVLDPSALSAEVVVEDTAGHGERFPHVYGPIDLDAVIEVAPFDAEAAAAGRWSPP